MSLLDEIVHVRFSEPGNWPEAVKVCALAGLVGSIILAGYFLDWTAQWAALDQARTREAELKNTYVLRKRSAMNLDVLRLQLADVEQTLRTLLTQLSDKSELDALLVDINRAGLGRGLQFELFKPAAREIIQDFYAELPVTFRATGSYHDIGAFASDLALLPRIVTLHDIEIIPGHNHQLVLHAVAKTYRYLDDASAELNEANP